jgi:Esterase/lipase
MNKTIWRIIKKWILLAGIVAVMLSAILVFITRFTPKPVAWLLRRVFDKPPKKPLEAIQPKAMQPKEAQEKAVAPQDDQEKAINIKDIQPKSIQEIENIHYGQEAKEVLDLYVPVEEGKYPVILWIHGGAFVGGDKKDVLYFARELTKKGYAVVAINGNTFSFASHGKALAKQLKKEGVEVDELFFDNEEKVVHEYQFDLSSKAGEKALRKTLRFLGEYS